MLFPGVISLQFYFNTATETGIHFEVDNSQYLRFKNEITMERCSKVHPVFMD